MKINRAVFEAYLTCKYKAWRVANGDKGAIHAYTQQLDQLQKEHVSIAAKTLLNKTKSEATVTLPAFTSDVIAQRHPVILNTTVNYHHFSFRCDGLKLIDNGVALSTSFYEPVLFNVLPRIREEHRLSLAFAAFLHFSSKTQAKAFKRSPPTILPLLTSTGSPRTEGPRF